MYRPAYPKYNEKLHELPDKPVMFDQVMENKVSKANAWRGRKGMQFITAEDSEWKYRFMSSVRHPKRRIRVSWVVDPTQSQDRRYLENVDVAVSMTEDICRAEADRLGLTCVVIRQLAHETRTLHRNGRTMTYFDPKSGKRQNAQRKADSHFTVWMDRSKYELLLQGHIYVLWDRLEVGGFREMDDSANQGKEVREEDGEDYVSEEYWSLTKDELRLKNPEANSAAVSS